MTDACGRSYRAKAEKKVWTSGREANFFAAFGAPKKDFTLNIADNMEI